MDDIASRGGEPPKAGFFRMLAALRGVRFEDINIKNEVGLTAGDIYRFLEKNGETYLKDLRMEFEKKGPLFMASLGWLLREDKIDVNVVKNGIKVKLRQ